MHRGRREGTRMTHADDLSAYVTFARSDWAALRSNTSPTLSDADLSLLRGLNEPITSAEVADFYLPLTRLLNLHFSAARNLMHVKAEFLGRPARGSPYIIALAGSVAVGKSTFARVLCALLARSADRPRVELVTTDGFLHSNGVLEERGLMRRKGFPESYNLPRMLRFLSAAKAGEHELELPVYSHLIGDIVPSERQVVQRADILIFEGLNVLHARGTEPVVVSDFFDFSIYLDADEVDIQSWYVERFLGLQRTASETPLHTFTTTGTFHPKTRARLPTGCGVSIIAPISERTFNPRGSGPTLCCASDLIIRLVKCGCGKRSSAFGPTRTFQPTLATSARRH